MTLPIGPPWPMMGTIQAAVQKLGAWKEIPQFALVLPWPCTLASVHRHCISGVQGDRELPYCFITSRVVSA